LNYLFFGDYLLMMTSESVDDRVPSGKVHIAGTYKEDVICATNDGGVIKYMTETGGRWITTTTNKASATVFKLYVEGADQYYLQLSDGIYLGYNSSLRMRIYPDWYDEFLYSNYNPMTKISYLGIEIVGTELYHKSTTTTTSFHAQKA
jgi:hypothetical protein